MGDFVDALIESSDESERYRDPDLSPPTDANEIDDAAMQRVVSALNVLRMHDKDRIGDWFGRFITLYRNAGEATPGPVPPRIEVEWALEHGGRLMRHPWTRMAWRRAARGARLYANGEALPLPLRDARRIAAAGEVDGVLYAALSQPGRDAVFDLFAAGHYELPDDAEE